MKCSKVFLEDLIAKSNITVLFNCILFLPESTEGVDPGQVTALDYENEANRTEKWEKRDEHWTD